MIELRPIWRQAGEGDTIHLMLASGDDQRHVILQRAENPTLYDFIEQHGSVPTTDTRSTSQIPT